MTKVISFDDNLIGLGKTIITFGNFDGVHLGHAELISTLVKKSKSINAKSVLLTFNKHTKKILCKDSEFKLITPIDKKIEILKSFGLDYIVIIDFNEKFSKISAIDFTKTIISKFNPAVIFLGYDNKFGHKGSGNIEFLREYLNNEETNVDIIEFNEFVIDDCLIKSSVIKNLISEGSVEKIKFYLAKNLEIDGVVVEGKKIGSTLGFPTANIKLKFSEQILPIHGVYYVNFKFGRKNYRGLCNIGFNPTFNSDPSIVNIETYLLTEEKLHLYGQEVSIEFIKRIRNEKKFNDKDELINQIKNDIESIESRSEINNG